MDRLIAKILAVVLYASFSDCQALRKYGELDHSADCLALSKEPNFDIDQVISKPWRIYYTWGVPMADKCLDLTFKNATPMIINRIYNDMHDYVETEPNWSAATLLASMGPASHELLLIADQGAAGSFIGVPNVIRDPNVTPMRRGVPNLKFYLKLLHEDKYLLMADCRSGIVSLSSLQRPPYKTEVAVVANSLLLGPGLPACVREKHKDEETAI